MLFSDFFKNENDVREEVDYFTIITMVKCSLCNKYIRADEVVIQNDNYVCNDCSNDLLKPKDVIM